MARREGILAKQDKRSTQREVTHIYFKFLSSLNSIYKSIEIYVTVVISRTCLCKSAIFTVSMLTCIRAKPRFYTMLYIRQNFATFLRQQHEFYVSICF